MPNALNLVNHAAAARGDALPMSSRSLAMAAASLVSAMGFALLLLLVSPAAAQNTSSTAQTINDKPSPNIVAGVRAATRDGGIRVVVETTSRPQVDVKVRVNPHRVVVDIAGALFFLSSNQTRALRQHFASFNFGAAPERADTARLVFAAASKIAIDREFTLPPDDKNPRYRTVIDLTINLPVSNGKYPLDVSQLLVTKEEDAAHDYDLAVTGGDKVTLADLTPLPPRARRSSLTAANHDGAALASLQNRPVVVIDAGHGGTDPGAEAEDGNLREKDIVLAVAMQVAYNLAHRDDMEVYVTRRADHYVSLANRVAIAQEVDASVFVSIHADAARYPHVSGATVYTLSEVASDAVAQQLAERENQADFLAGHGISHIEDELGSNILLDLAQRDAVNRSVALAQRLIRSISRVARLNRRPHRHAGFRVLKTVDIPSVLVEVGYMTNAQDRQNLRSFPWRHQVAEAIARAVIEFIESPTDTLAQGARFNSLSDAELMLGLMERNAPQPLEYDADKPASITDLVEQVTKQ